MTNELADFALSSQASVTGDTAFALHVVADGKPDPIGVKRVGLDRESRARRK